MVAGRRRGIIVVMAGTALGTTHGTALGTTRGMILGIMAATATMAGRLPGVMAGMVPTIVRGATTATTHLFIIMGDEDIASSIPGLQV